MLYGTYCLQILVRVHCTYRVALDLILFVFKAICDMFSACAWPASGIGCKLLLALRLCRACVKSVTFCKVVWLGVTVVSVAAMLGQIVVMFKAC